MFKYWLRAIGFYRGFFIVSLAPASLGLLSSIENGHPFHPLKFILAVAGILSFHIGTNLINDYYDYISGTDVINKIKTPFSGGTRVIVDCILNKESVKKAAICSFVLGFIFFGILSVLTGPVVLVLAFLGWFSGYYYSAPPLKLAYRGLGELFIGLNFGPLIAATTYYSQSLHLSLDLLLISSVVGLLSFAIIMANEFPDYEADMASGKNNLLVVTGLTTGSILHGMLIFSAITLAVTLSFYSFLHIFAAMSVVFFPLGYAISGKLRRAPQDLGVMTYSSEGTIKIFTGVWTIITISLMLDIFRN